MPETGWTKYSPKPKKKPVAEWYAQPAVPKARTQKPADYHLHPPRVEEHLSWKLQQIERIEVANQENRSVKAREKAKRLQELKKNLYPPIKE